MPLVVAGSIVYFSNIRVCSAAGRKEDSFRHQPATRFEAPLATRVTMAKTSRVFAGVLGGRDNVTTAGQPQGIIDENGLVSLEDV